MDRSRDPRSWNFSSGSRIADGADRITDRPWDSWLTGSERKMEHRLASGGLRRGNGCRRNAGAVRSSGHERRDAMALGLEASSRWGLAAVAAPGLDEGMDCWN